MTPELCAVIKSVEPRSGPDIDADDLAGPRCIDGGSKRISCGRLRQLPELREEELEDRGKGQVL
jgi:hypothetical protein